MCQALQASRSGYYAWEGRKPSKRKQDDAKYTGILFKAFHESNKTYGCGRLASVLEDMGIHIGRRRISRLQREQKLFPVQRKKFYNTTDSNHGLPICRNLVRQDFSASRPNALWTSDVKMVRTHEPKFRSWGGCEYMLGTWREGGAGHIRRVICPRRMKRCVEPVETRQSAQQIFTPFIRVRYTGLRPKLFVSIALCGRSAASNCGI